MRTLRRALTVAAAVLAMSGSAQAATTLGFDDLAQAGTGFDYLGPARLDYQGFSFVSGNSESPHFIVWRTGDTRNADLGGGTLAHRWDRTYLTVSRTDGAVFDLLSLDVAGIQNAGKAFGNSFQFNYADGRQEFLGVTTDQFVGLQTINFNRKGLVSFSYVAAPLEWWQIDNMVVDSPVSAVPEPAAWALMISGFGAAGALLRRRRASGLMTA